MTIGVITSRGRGFGDSALGEGLPDRVHRLIVNLTQCGHKQGGDNKGRERGSQEALVGQVY